MKPLKTIIQILLLVIIPGIIQAIESFPPIVPEGETIPDIQDVMKHISQANSIYCIDFSPDGRTIAMLRPSGLKFTELIERVWPSKRLISLPVDTSHKRMV